MRSHTCHDCVAVVSLRPLTMLPMNLPPGPSGVLGTRHLMLLRRRPESFLRLARKYGDIAYFRIGHRDVVLVSRLDWISEILGPRTAQPVERDWGPRRGTSGFGNGLLTSEGAHHREQRRNIAAMFSRDRLLALGPRITTIIDAWARRHSNGQTIDLAAEVTRLSSELTATVLLGSRVDPGELSLFVEVVRRRFQRAMYPWANRFRVRKPPVEKLASIIRDVRSAPRTEIPGLLSGFLDEQSQSADDQIGTFIVTGQETMASSLMWSFYLLSTAPDVQRSMREADTFEPGSQRGTWAEAVLKESLRLYPPQWMIGRRNLEPLRLGDYDIPARSLLLTSPFVVQRDARNFDDPAAFRPERWMSGNPPPPAAWFPFGAGPRRCIGEAFAMMTAAMLLDRFVRSWEIKGSRDVPGQDVRLIFRPSALQVTIRSAGAA